MIAQITFFVINEFNYFLEMIAMDVSKFEMVRASKMAYVREVDQADPGTPMTAPGRLYFSAAAHTSPQSSSSK